MEVETIKIEALVLDPNNARKHSQRNLEAIKGSLAKFGQQTQRFFSRVEIVGNCWEFTEIQPHTGYGKFCSNGITWRAHRWIMWALGDIEYKDPICVLHKCDNRSCVNPEHLYLGDRLKNAMDIKERGRTHLIRDPKLGSKNPQAKLNEKKVLDIRRDISTGVLSKCLADKYGVSKTTISNIKTRKLWNHI